MPAIHDIIFSPFGRWISGLYVALIGGHATIQLFFWYLERTMGQPPKDTDGVYVPDWLTGLIERTFFTVLIGASGSVTTIWIVPSMFGWIAAKIAANWGRKDTGGDKPYTNDRAWTIRALLANLISMFFALVGGWIIVSVGNH